MLEFLVEAQRSIRGLLLAYLTAYADSRDIWQLATLFPFAVVFGVAHALTPGHSKAVLASYVLGAGATVRRAIGMSLLLAVTHVSSAILLASITNNLVTRTVVGAGQVLVLEWLSRGALVLLGAWLVIRPLLNRPHVHGEAQGFAFFAGLIPCPLTLFIMTLAYAKGVPFAGLTFALAMLSGVALVLTAVAGGALAARKSLLAFFQRHNVKLELTARATEMACGALLAIAGYELI